MLATLLLNVTGFFLISGFLTNIPLSQNDLERREVATQQRNGHSQEHSVNVQDHSHTNLVIIGNTASKHILLQSLIYITGL